MSYIIWIKGDKFGTYRNNLLLGGVCAFPFLFGVSLIYMGAGASLPLPSLDFSMLDAVFGWFFPGRV